MGKKKPKKNKSKPRKNSAPLPGRTLEQAVARIQQMMDPNSTVTHDEWLVDRFDNRRQFDVVIRGTFAGQPMLGVMECKDHNRKKGPDAVEAFAKKAENVGANFKIIVSRLGFTQQAIRLAKKEHVGCLSMLPEDPMQTGWGLGSYHYARIRRWTQVRIRLHPAEKCDAPDLAVNPVLWQGLPVMNWILRRLFADSDDARQQGKYTFTYMFKEPQTVSIGGREYLMRAVGCEAEWIRKNKKNWVQWSGDAFYDWHTDQITVPANGTIVGGAMPTDFLVWDDYDDEIPTTDEISKSQSFTLIMSDVQKIPDHMPVPDLDSLLAPNP